MGRDFDGAFCGLADFKTTDHPMVGFTLNVNRVLNSTSARELLDLPYTALANMTIFREPKDIMAYLQPVCIASCFSADSTGSGGAEKFERTLKYTHNGKMLGRFCVPAVEGLDHTFLPYSEYIPERLLRGWQQAAEELSISWPAIAACAVVACVVGFLWLVALRLLGGALVYVAITLFLAAFFVTGGVGMWFVHARAVPAETVRPGVDPQGTVMASFWIEVARYSSYTLLGLGGVFAVLLVFLSQCIREAVAVTKVAAMFLHHKPTAVAVPVITVSLQAAYFCIAVYTAACLVTAVDVFPDKVNAIIGGVQPSRSLVHRANQSIQPPPRPFDSLLPLSRSSLDASSSAPVALTQPDPLSSPSTTHLTNTGVVVKSLGVAIKYHLGSLAFGSFILSVIKLFKWFLRYLAAQHRHIKKGGSAACVRCSPCGVGKLLSTVGACNTVWAALIGILRYLVKCFEKCIEFLDRQAYIQIALTGKNFCHSAWIAFKVVMEHPIRIGLAVFLGKALSFLGTVVVAASATAAGFFLAQFMYSEKLSSFVYTTLVCAVCNLAIASVFHEVYRMAVATTIQCYFADRRLSVKTGQPPIFTPEPLRKFLHGHGQE
ncbi:hypothetical protein NCLIV_013580 [Neospora caninum Liverpool]|nr:hypothetical protein NCLIV_013580 [Neospora caninum Liverpool]CBZ51565.1 hypothetical protein NCLIV_013580 [Neospora caninum Liverpool]|eukprot:XP_003881598.1 hypothetical protein NCLIV_013580 [Neospora caninum Liverpool]